jgi:hypothetical protein
MSRCTDLAQIVAILDVFCQDGALNVYAGAREVRPPRAPTTGTPLGDSAVVRRMIGKRVPLTDWSSSTSTAARVVAMSTCGY